MDQQTLNQKVSQIINSLVSKLYLEITEKNGDAISGILNFDNDQKITEITNLFVNANPKIPAFELVEELNKISTELSTLPDLNKLKSLEIAVCSDMKMNIKPNYLN